MFEEVSAQTLIILPESSASSSIAFFRLLGIVSGEHFLYVSGTVRLKAEPASSMLCSYVTVSVEAAVVSAVVGAVADEAAEVEDAALVVSVDEAVSSVVSVVSSVVILV